jgi:hypothetical protein
VGEEETEDGVTIMFILIASITKSKIYKLSVVYIASAAARVGFGLDLC